ncbi:MAG TPA: hypothetical protein VF244_01520 [Acidimicrobiales bacterium]
MTDTSEKTDTAEDGEPTDEVAPPEATGDDHGSGPDPRLLEELDEHIREARAAAEEAFADSGHSLVERGDHDDEDDRANAPG